MVYSKSAAMAEKFYRTHEQDRNYHLDRARTCARLTMPYLIPESAEPTYNSKENYSTVINRTQCLTC